MYIELTNRELKKAISEYLQRTFKISGKDISFNDSHIVNHKISIDDIDGISNIEINTYNIESGIIVTDSPLQYAKVQGLMES